MSAVAITSEIVINNTEEKKCILMNIRFINIEFYQTIEYREETNYAYTNIFQGLFIIYIVNKVSIHLLMSSKMIQSSSTAQLSPCCC